MPELSAVTQPVTNRGHPSLPGVQGARDPASLDSHQGRRGQGQIMRHQEPGHHYITLHYITITETVRPSDPPSLPPKTRGTPRLPPKPLDNSPRQQGGHTADQRHRGHSQGGHQGVHSVSSTSAKRPLPPLPPPRVPPPPPPMPK